MIVKRIPAGIYAANCYIIMEEESKETAVIDPGGDSHDIIKALAEIGAELKYILLTHGHGDHTGGVIDIREKYGIPVYINRRDKELIENNAFIFNPIGDESHSDSYISEGEILYLGKAEIQCIETPGHTPGGMCYLIEGMLFSGDTLFSGSIGRSDLAGGNHSTLVGSIKSKLYSLPGDTKVMPGHGPQSTIDREKKTNPFVRGDNAVSFDEY